MRKLKRPLVPALAASLALVGAVAGSPAARAETVTVHDPSGDTRHHLGYDITRVRVEHKAKRIAFELDQSFTPYWYEIRVDVPGPKPWKYLVTWTAYTPRKVFVQRRHADDNVCVRRNAHTNADQTVLRFVVPRSCFGPPKAVRVKAIAWDDEFGWSDRTGWTEWAHVS
ncbi:hypothetical protein [Nocardioides panacisoli]|uniref:Secreted protein n=1 Tax=Nocardioides panacisoli TaxID=627624 RepID=A0ABP7I086_9ACTN